MRRTRDVLTPEQLAAYGLTGDEPFIGADDDPPTPEELYQEGDITWRQYVEGRACLDHFASLPAGSRPRYLTHAEMRRDPRFRARLGDYARVQLMQHLVRPRGAGRPRARRVPRATTRSGDSGDDEPPPESLGRSRYRRDLLRVLDRFGSVANGLRWLRGRSRRPELPPSDFWTDDE
jgi:hypothetical protein